MSMNYRSYSDTHPELTPAEVAKHCGVHRDTVVRYRRMKNGASKPQAARPAKRSHNTVTGGISLDGVRVSNDKPQSNLFSLKRGLAYPVIELAKQWRVSPETIRKHARRFEALKYVEVNGEWVACVINPETEI